MSSGQVILDCLCVARAVAFGKIQDPDRFKRARYNLSMFAIKMHPCVPIDFDKANTVQFKIDGVFVKGLDHLDIDPSRVDQIRIGQDKYIAEISSFIYAFRFANITQCLRVLWETECVPTSPASDQINIMVARCQEWFTPTLPML